MDVYHQRQTCNYPAIYAKVWPQAPFIPALIAYPHSVLLITDFPQASLHSIKISINQNIV